MSKGLTITTCPKCDAEMEQGVIGTGLGFGGEDSRKCSSVWWSDEFKMGFLGKPKGEDVSGKNIDKKYMAIPAARCTGCRLVLFEY